MSARNTRPPPDGRKPSRYHREVLKQADWDGAVAVAMGGEGSTAANGFWAALNIVTTLRLPMIFSIENNNYGLSVPSELQTPCGDITANLACFQNLLTIDVDGTDPENAWQAVCQAFEHAAMAQDRSCCSSTWCG